MLLDLKSKEVSRHTNGTAAYCSQASFPSGSMAELPKAGKDGSIVSASTGAADAKFEATGGLLVAVELPSLSCRSAQS